MTLSTISTKYQKRRTFPNQKPPYHVFSKSQKWFVIIIIGAAGLFSGLSSNIYFPAMNEIASVTPSTTPNYAILLIFRGLQAAGSASTVSAGNGVIQDISPPAERGSFIAFYQAIRNFSIAIGLALGGRLSEFFGFRAIFGFLLALSSLVLTFIILFPPETLRTIAGNGSLKLTGIYLPFVQRLTTKGPKFIHPVTVMTFVEPLKLLIEPDIFMVTSRTTRLFKQSFGLNEILIGLAFLPNTIIGKLMTRDFASFETAYRTQHASTLAPSFKIAKNIPLNFPIERARLRHLPWISILFVIATGCYGFSLAFPTLTARSDWIGMRLVLQFVITATSNAVFALSQTIVAALCPGRGASATAVNNLVRCGLGAVGAAVVDALISAVGVAPAFWGFAMLTVAFAPFAVLNWYWELWCGRRMERQQRRERKGVEEKI
ncbi:major facilitator superfamily domain-containing protein [Apodospora peruviana]|uniref:Major facilitator superfamily domain-containing protein n=1 Tax=Apodospora peruviana TaxID=516989 RepID=A0AAE0HYH8_9PEZI|nr:major facilitator superfamily domain-containing protein [Apodospora peruviana]